MQTNSRFSDRGALGAAYFDPSKPVYVEDTTYGGYYEWLQNNGNPNVLAAKNPVGLINQKNDISKVQRYIGNAKFSYNPKFLPRLTLNYNAGMDFSEGKGTLKYFLLPLLDIFQRARSIDTGPLRETIYRKLI